MVSLRGGEERNNDFPDPMVLVNLLVPDDCEENLWEETNEEHLQVSYLRKKRISKYSCSPNGVGYCEG